MDETLPKTGTINKNNKFIESAIMDKYCWFRCSSAGLFEAIILLKTMEVLKDGLQA
jgi:hypothetical protein